MSSVTASSSQDKTSNISYNDGDEFNKEIPKKDEKKKFDSGTPDKKFQANPQILVASSGTDGWDGGWNSDYPSYPAPGGDYGTGIQYKDLGQYGNGLQDDFAASYGGLTNEDQEAALQDPNGFAQKDIANNNQPVDPNEIIGPVESYDETVGPSGPNGHIANELLASGIVLGDAGASAGAAKTLREWKDKGGSDKAGRFLQAAGDVGGVLGGALSIAGIFTTLFGAETKIYTGAAVDNVENAKSFTNNVAAYGATAEAGQKIMDNQANMMNEMADKLQKNDDGSFKDPEYAMKAVNQLMRLSGQDPAFVAKGNSSLPEATTGNGESDIPLPADVFAIGASGPRTDASHALINETNDRTARDQIADASKDDAQTGVNIGNDWKDKANSYVDGTPSSKASSRETGMARMVNDFDGQVEKTGQSLDNYNKAYDNLLSKVEDVMDPEGFDSLAQQAGPAIRQNYAKQQGTNDVNRTAPVDIEVNPKSDVKTNSVYAYNFFHDLGLNAKKKMENAYNTGADSALGQVQQELHANLMASGKELSPFDDINKAVSDPITTLMNKMNLSGKEPDQKDVSKAREEFIKSYKDIGKVYPDGPEGSSIMNNIFKSGMDMQLSVKGTPLPGTSVPIDPNTHQPVPIAPPGTTMDANTETFKLQVDDADQDPGAIFDQLWDQAKSLEQKEFPSDTKLQMWGFSDFKMVGVAPDIASDKAQQ